MINRDLEKTLIIFEKMGIEEEALESLEPILESLYYRGYRKGIKECLKPSNITINTPKIKESSGLFIDNL